MWWRGTEREEEARSFLMFWHGRLGHALAPLAFALLGTPLALWRRRSGRAWGYLLALAGYVTYYVVSRLFENLAMNGRVPIPVAGQLANVAFAAAGALALHLLGRAGAAR